VVLRAERPEAEAGEGSVSRSLRQGRPLIILPDYDAGARSRGPDALDVVFIADRTGDYRFGSCEWTAPRRRS
jgi:hypothetical protein